MNNKRPHISILENEMAEIFAGSTLKVYVDGTLGAGGHAKRILQEHPEIECFIGFDQDPDALAIAKETLREWEGKIHLVHANFDQLTEVLQERGVTAVDGFFLTSEFRPCSSIKS